MLLSTQALRLYENVILRKSVLMKSKVEDHDICQVLSNNSGKKIEKGQERLREKARSKGIQNFIALFLQIFCKFVMLSNK